MHTSRLWMGAGAMLLLAARFALAADVASLDGVIADVGLQAGVAARIRRGELVHSDPKESSEREMAVGLTFLVHQTPAQVVTAFRATIDLKANPQLSTSVPIGGAGTAADFASLVLEPQGAAEAQRYRTAGPGDTLNLSPEEIKAFNALTTAADGAKLQVEAQLKLLLLSRYQTYLSNGLRGMAPYARRGGLCNPADELRRASDAARLLKKYAPALQQLLLSYPQGQPAGLEEHFYWLRYELDGRPNFTLRHRLALPAGEAFVVADREFYVSHGYNTLQAFAVLVPVPEGTAVVYRARVSTDQVAGFGSSMKKGIGRSVMAKQLTNIFERTRDAFKEN